MGKYKFNPFTGNLDLESNDIGVQTGILSGGIVTINADPTKFDVSAGSGYIANWSDPNNPVITKVTWSAFTAQSPTNLALLYTPIFIDVNGALIKNSGVTVTPQLRRQYIYLNTLSHTNGTTITSVPVTPLVSYDVGQSFVDYALKNGPIVSGNNATFNGANLNVNKTSGESALPFINVLSDPLSPTLKTNAAVTLCTFSTTYPTSPTTYNFTPGVTAIDPTLKQNGTALVAVGNNKFTIKRFYYFPIGNNFVVTFGEQEYSSIANAEASLFSESPNINPVLSAGVWTTALIVKKECTALNNTAEAKFITIETKARGANAASATLQSAYDSSIPDPEILTSTTNGALTIRRGSASDTDNILALQNNAGTINLGFQGNGKVNSGRGATDDGFEFNKTTPSTTGFTFSLAENNTKFLKTAPNYFEIGSTSLSNSIGAGTGGSFFGYSNTVDAGLSNVVIFGYLNEVYEGGGVFVAGADNLIYATGGTVIGSSNVSGATGVGDYAVYIIGDGCTSETQSAVTIGVTNVNQGFESVVIGSSNNCYSSQSSVIGYNQLHTTAGSGLYSFGTVNSGSSGICVGSNNVVNNSASAAVGLYLETNALRAIAIGSGSPSVKLLNSISNSLVMASGASTPCYQNVNAKEAFINNLQIGLLDHTATPSGAEIVVNGSFTTDTNFTKGTGWTISGGVAVAAAGTASNLEQAISNLEVGAWYKVQFTMSGYVAGTLTASFVTSTSAGQARASNATHTELLYASSTSDTIRLRKSSTGAFSVDNLTVKKITTGSASVMGDFKTFKTTQIGTGGTAIQSIRSATASLNFGSVAAGGYADLTMTLTGAADGDTVSLGVPNAVVGANAEYFAWVSAANTVTIRLINNDVAAYDPASATFRATIIKF